MRRFDSVLLVFMFCLTAVLWVPDTVSAQDVDPGVDLWVTPPTGNTYINFAVFPIPADFFGPGSDPFFDMISLMGDPLITSPPDILGPTDAIVKRSDPATLPACGTSDPVEIEIVALSLVSIEPIVVTFNGGQNPELWDVDVCLSSNTPQEPGIMIVTKECEDGGSFTADLPVLPKLTFTRVESPHNQSEFDFGNEGLPSIPLVTSDGKWQYSDRGFNVITTSGGDVDHDCNPSTADIPFGSSSNFKPSIEGLPCDCENNGSDYNIVLTYLENPQLIAGHGVLPPLESPQDIPTLSEWGMLIMGLLLLVIGTVAVVKRRKRAISQAI